MWHVWHVCNADNVRLLEDAFVDDASDRALLRARDLIMLLQYLEEREVVEHHEGIERRDLLGWWVVMEPMGGDGLRWVAMVPWISCSCTRVRKREGDEVYHLDASFGCGGVLLGNSFSKSGCVAVPRAESRWPAP